MDYHPEPKTFEVIDYDFTFTNGLVMPVSINAALGDTIEFGQDIVGVHLSAKPSLVDPDTTLAEEDVQIFVKQLVSVQKRKRSVMEVTTAAKQEWEKVFKEVSKTKH